MPPREIFDVVVRKKAQTDKAVLVTVDDKNYVWLPTSQIEIEPNKDGTFMVTAPVWLLQDKGLL